MINFDKQNVEAKVKEAYNKIKGLRKRTKELICIGMTVMMLGTFVIYDVSTGVAYASGSGEGTPYSIKAGDYEIATVQSRNDAEMVVENIKEAYGKDNSTTTAMITPAITIEEKEYVTAENVDIKNAQEATQDILSRNSGDNPIFEVSVQKPVVMTQVIDHETKVVKDDDLEKGKTEVKTEGKNGKKIVLGQQTLVNGKVESSVVYSEEVTENPVTEVVYEGTKEEEEETTTTSTASTSSRSTSSKKSTSSKVSYNASKSNGIVGYAMAFHGVPYVYGGASPSGFDCSGFTQYVYRAFGINLPHSSSAQAGYGRAVSASEARPGDLVVMPGHVGIYAGNGMITHSPAPGQSVKTQAIWQGCSFRRLV